MINPDAGLRRDKKKALRSVFSRHEATIRPGFSTRNQQYPFLVVQRNPAIAHFKKPADFIL